MGLGDNFEMISCLLSVEIEDLTRVVISCEIYMISLMSLALLAHTDLDLCCTYTQDFLLY